MVMVLECISLTMLQRLKSFSNVLTPFLVLAVLTARDLGRMLIICMWKRCMTLSMLEWPDLLVVIPTSISLCLMAEPGLSLMTPSIRSSPPSRPTTRLSGMVLMLVAIAMCETLGCLAGEMDSEPTPNV